MNKNASVKTKYKTHRRHHIAQSASKTSRVIKIICAAIICTILFGGFYASAQNNRTEEPVNYKYYKSITIESGDSLWSLAEEYMTEDYESVEEYIQVLKEINGLYSDTILAGQKIVIAYNDTTFIE